MTYILQILCPTMSFQIGDVFKVPIAYGNKDAISEVSNLNISISKLDWDAHETSWDFAQNELVRLSKGEWQEDEEMSLASIAPSDDEPDSSHYSIMMEQSFHHDGTIIPSRWNTQHTQPSRQSLSLADLVAAYKHTWERRFHQLHANEEELNRQFIEIYGLQDELTPDVPLDEITILQQGEINIEE